jgi:hypothetical protein
VGTSGREGEMHKERVNEGEYDGCINRNKETIKMSVFQAIWQMIEVKILNLVAEYGQRCQVQPRYKIGA